MTLRSQLIFLAPSPSDETRVFGAYSLFDSVASSLTVQETETTAMDKI